jgi:hypothetical protein
MRQTCAGSPEYRVCAFARDLFERISQVAVDDFLSWPGKLAVLFQVDFAAVCGDVQLFPVVQATVLALVLRRDGMEMPAHEVAVSRIADSSRKKFGPFQRPEAFMGVPHELEHAGRGDGARAAFVLETFHDESEAGSGFLQVFLLPHVGPRLERTAADAFKYGVQPAFRGVDLHDAHAADASHDWVHDALHQRAGNGGIDRIAARPQGFDARIDRFGLGRGHHAGQFRHAWNGSAGHRHLRVLDSRQIGIGFNLFSKQEMPGA